MPAADTRVCPAGAGHALPAGGRCASPKLRSRPASPLHPHSVIIRETSVMRGLIPLLRERLSFGGMRWRPALEKGHRKGVRSTNMVEGLNREFPRRSRAVRIFADERSCVPLVSAPAMEFNEQWMERRHLGMEAQEASKALDGREREAARGCWSPWAWPCAPSGIESPEMSLQSIGDLTLTAAAAQRFQLSNSLSYMQTAAGYANTLWPRANCFFA